MSKEVDNFEIGVVLGALLFVIIAMGVGMALMHDTGQFEGGCKVLHGKVEGEVCVKGNQIILRDSDL